jgi:hypothetical protein
LKSAESFKRGVSKARRLWRDGRVDLALTQVQGLLGEWPDNPRLLVMRAMLTQLQDDVDGIPTLVDVKADLTRASGLDDPSPDPLIELGYYSFAVEDDARKATRYFDKAVHLSVDLLTQALVGQAEALSELGQEAQASRCLMTACSLVAQYRSSVRESVLEKIKELMETTMEAQSASANGAHE